MVGRVLTLVLYGAGVLLYFIGAAPLVRFLGRKNAKILLYHDCADCESDYVADLECTTSPIKFLKHLNYLARHYKIVPLDTVLSGNAPPKAVAITFDDGYASVYHNAFPILATKSAPATVYLISSAIDNRSLVWVNEVNHLLRRSGRDGVRIVQRYFDVQQDATPAEIITVCRVNYVPSKIHALLSDLREHTGISDVQNAHDAKLYLTWDQIREMRAAGVEFGNHSRTHPNMECLSEEEQFAEIEGAQRDLEKYLPGVHAYAHPFGHKGTTTASLASKVGLSSAADVGGYNYPVKALSVGRTHMTNEGVPGLFSRMEVVEPVKAMLRRLLGSRDLRTTTLAAQAVT